MHLSKQMKSAILGTFLAVSSSALADSAITGTVPATKDQRRQWSTMAKVSLAEAKEIALRAAPGTVDDADLELENGFLVYEVEVKDSAGVEHELVIDAGSGTVLKKSIDK